jgi:hypothetical protein
MIALSQFAPTTAADTANVQFLVLAFAQLHGLVLTAIPLFARTIAQIMVFALVVSFKRCPRQISLKIYVHCSLFIVFVFQILCANAMTAGKVMIALKLSVLLVASTVSALLLINANVRRDSLDSLAQRLQFALQDATAADTVVKMLEFAIVPRDGHNLTV